MLQVSD